ncbi:hypothetical protein Sango_0083800 [Sesamum angolense]|uniref:Reverse transcriptase domain-containing protein n=1 Tax=Sesamum angolense TaxID=2727404 RepID=A0AAE1XE83_9LAMI|nr:hypothetical protein Sango_0083800 [Sesamum angolense]
MVQFRARSYQEIYSIYAEYIGARANPKSAFILGHLITDNILVVYELNHFLKSKTGGQKGEAENSNSVKGVKIARSAPCISHLLFADDPSVFFEASLSAMQEVSRLLSKYEAASGQKVNLEKSCMVLSWNVEQFDRVLFAEALGIKVIEKHDKHLGLPAVGGRSKRDMFDGIREKKLEMHSGVELEVVKPSRKRECVNEKALEVWGSDISRTFDDALLAKQAWRIIQHLKSLVGRIFKAKILSLLRLLSCRPRRAPISCMAKYPRVTGTYCGGLLVESR